MADFKPVNPEDKLFMELMPTLIGIGPAGDLHAYGSCFVAWPHMAVTAKHVVTELLDRDPGIRKDGTASIEYWVIQVVWEGEDFRYVVWTIDSVAMSPHSDIAILWLKPFDENAEDYKKRRLWKSVPMTFDPPPVGSPVRGFGLHDVSFEGSKRNAEGKFQHIEFKSKNSVSLGVVRAHYWDLRDRAMYNFPCFEVDAKFESGMSGGLVIDQASRVCGIISGSLPASSDDEPHISYVTMLYPMLAIELDPKLMPDVKAPHLVDLSKRHGFHPEGWDRVLINFSADSEGRAMSTIQYLMKTLVQPPQNG